MKEISMSLLETERSLRGHNFYPSEDVLGYIPVFYQTENIPIEYKSIYLHFFGGDMDYYVSEINTDTGEVFGVIVRGNCKPEWGYSLLAEMETVKIPMEIRTRMDHFVWERDLDWVPTLVKDIPKLQVK